MTPGADPADGPRAPHQGLPLCACGDPAPGYVHREGGADAEGDEPGDGWDYRESTGVEISPEEFEELVDAGLRRIPKKLLDAAHNVAIVTEDRNAQWPQILGLYEGVALTERTSDYNGFLPDKITIYRLPLCDIVSSREELVEQVAVTVIHELGHHFGIDDARLHELGWA